MMPGCEVSCKRKADLKRHEETVHRPKRIFWCPVPGCKRNNCQNRVSKPFTRKDKRDDHVIRVHIARSRTESTSTVLDFISSGTSERSQGFEFGSKNETVPDFSGCISIGDARYFVTTHGVPPVNTACAATYAPHEYTSNQGHGQLGQGLAPDCTSSGITSHPHQALGMSIGVPSCAEQILIISRNRRPEHIPGWHSALRIRGHP
jgi:hypothetical protein